MIIVEACDFVRALKSLVKERLTETQRSHMVAKIRFKRMEGVRNVKRRRTLIKMQRYRWIVKAVLLCSDLEEGVERVKYTDLMSINELQKQKTSEFFHSR